MRKVAFRPHLCDIEMKIQLGFFSWDAHMYYLENTGIANMRRGWENSLSNKIFEYSFP